MTDTINLPWILASGELRPTWNSDTGIGRTRFLWGTTSPDGDLTSGPQIRIHGSKEREWLAGAFHLVRFTLAADEFSTWNEIVQASNWTPEEVTALIEDDATSSRAQLPPITTPRSVFKVGTLRQNKRLNRIKASRELCSLPPNGEVS